MTSARLPGGSTARVLGGPMARVSGGPISTYLIRGGSKNNPRRTTSKHWGHPTLGRNDSREPFPQSAVLAPVDAQIQLGAPVSLQTPSRHQLHAHRNGHADQQTDESEEEATDGQCQDDPHGV